MKISVDSFLRAIKDGKTEDELNLVEDHRSIADMKADGVRKGNSLNIPPTLRYLVQYQNHTEQSAHKVLNTDYTNGYTVCKKCGSYSHLGKGFTKHVSDGCYHCQKTINWSLSESRDGIQTCRYYDDGMFYQIRKVEVERFKSLVQELFAE